MAKLTTTKIVGSASETEWVQAQVWEYKDSEQVMAVVEVKSEDNESMVDLVTVGSGILNELERKTPLMQNQGQIKEVVEQIVREIKEGLKVGILLARVEGQKLNFYGNGRMTVYLARDGQIAKLKDNWSDKQEVAGEIKDDDRVVLTTEKLVDLMGISQFKDILINDNNPAEGLAPQIHAQKDTSAVGAIVGIVKVEKPAAIKWPQIKLKSDEPRRILDRPRVWVHPGCARLEER